MEFHFERWRDFQEQLFEQYPTNPLHQRIELSLGFPSDRLEDVWVHDWNPHHEIGNYHLTNYDCFYDSWNWSTIFDVYPAHMRTDGGSCRIFAEEGHQNPWGQRLRLMSTASSFYNDSSHRYVYLNNKYWKVMSVIQYPRIPWWERLNLIDNFFGDLPEVFLETMWLATFGTTTPDVNWQKEGF